MKTKGGLDSSPLRGGWEVSRGGGVRTPPPLPRLLNLDGGSKHIHVLTES